MKKPRLISDMSIIQKLSIALVPVILAFLLTSSYIFWSMSNSLKQSILSANQITLHKIHDDITTSITNLNEESIRLLITPNLREYLTFQGTPEAEELIKSQFFGEVSGNNVISGNMVKSVFFIKEADNYIYYSSSWGLSTEEIKTFAADIFTRYSSIRQVQYQNTDQTDYEKYGILRIIYPVTTTSGSLRERLLLVVNVNNSFIANIFSKKYSEGMLYFITDNSGNLIYRMSDDPETAIAYDYMSDSSTGDYMEVGKGQDAVIIMRENIESLGWKVYIQVPYATVFHELNNYKTIFLITSLISILLSGIFIYIASSSVVNRISEINAVMNSVKKGDLDVKFPVAYKDEISMVGNELNNMIEQIKYLHFDITEKELRQREAEIMALQSQINPHFLYNTLELTRMVAVKNNDPETSDVIEILSDLLRYTITPGEDNKLVTVSQEIKHIKAYLKIQKLRFGDRFLVVINIDPEIEKFYTIKLLIQPLVENAFSHGIKNIEEGGVISISGKIADGRLELVIADNGKGIAPDKLKELRDILNLHPFQVRGKKMIGLPNVNNRIKLFYGEHYGVRIESTFHQGTRVIVTLPIIKEPDARNNKGGNNV